MTMISVVIPLLNEAETLPVLHQRLTDVLMETGRSYEVVYVDDGSSDGSLDILVDLHHNDGEHVRIVEFRRNFGKTAALVAGFEQAAGEVIVTMDADLQDDPAEIPTMLAVLEAGHDVVAAWRIQRQDRPSKRLSSRLWNYLVKKASGTSFHDLNCGFKAYRREVITSIRLYSGMHRLIPILAAAQGFKVVEQPVSHHPRYAGRSKYGTRRAARGFMDLILVLFLTRYARNPLRLFGWMGMVVFSAGAAAFTYLATLWLLRFVGAAEVAPIGTRPLFFASILGMILGFQLISIGLLGEMVRYYTYRPSGEYTTRRIWK